MTYLGNYQGQDNQIQTTVNCRQRDASVRRQVLTWKDRLILGYVTWQLWFKWIAGLHCFMATINTCFT